MADLFVLQRYLQPVELEFLNISRFNEWINTFCTKHTEFEIDTTAASFRFVTRFDRFHNLPELMALFGNVCDFYRIDPEELGLPSFNGHVNIPVPRSEEQAEYIKRIVERTDAIRHCEVSPTEDNYLKIATDGRKCALDIRLVVPELILGKAPAVSKASSAASVIRRLYDEYPGMTQAVFCDISTPGKGFNLYEELRRLLTEAGIPEDEIAFIHEASTDTAREKLIRKFNAGELRVLLGSTPKLGLGVNIQERLVAVHHIDAPWKPSDMVQREGRAIRQGNQNSEIQIYRYVTESSFDAYTWQILENKQRFISSFLSGNLDRTHRSEADIVVNSNILYSMGIPEFEVAGTLAIHTTPDGQEGYRFSAEEVYKMLLQKAVLCGIPDSDPDRSSDDPSGLSGSGERGNEKGDVSISGGESDSAAGSSSGSFDSHEIWASVEENDAVTDQWKKLTIEGGKKYSSSEMPLSVRDYILELEKEIKVDWRRVLQDFIQLYHDRFDYSFSPSDRRYTWSDFIIPAFSEQDEEQVENLWFFVDTSGSISRDLLSEVLSEIRQAILLFDHLSGKLSFFDTHVTDPIPFEDEEDLLDIPAAGGGGTSYAAIFRFLKKFSEEDRPSVIIILTDGYCDYPQESASMDIPVLWIIYDNPIDPPWGRYVHVVKD